MFDTMLSVNCSTFVLQSCIYLHFNTSISACPCFGGIDVDWLSTMARDSQHLIQISQSNKTIILLSLHLVSPGAAPTHAVPFLADDLGTKDGRNRHVEQMHGEGNGEHMIHGAVMFIPFLNDMWTMLYRASVLDTGPVSGIIPCCFKIATSWRPPSVMKRSRIVSHISNSTTLRSVNSISSVVVSIDISLPFRRKRHVQYSISTTSNGPTLEYPRLPTSSWSIC